MERSHEYFEHTADLGLRIHAPDLRGLLVEAGEALSAALVDNFDAIEPTTRKRVTIEGDEPDYLLRDWLAELLYLFEGDRFIGGRFELVLTASGVEATVLGEAYDAQRHGHGQELKAITYHGLLCERRDDGWIGEVIIDL